MSATANWAYIFKATVWPKATRDNWTGAQTFGSPVVINCAYQAKAELRRDAMGKEFTSRLVFYTEHAANPGDYIKVGEHSGANPLALGAEQILSVGRTPDLFDQKADDYEAVT